MSADGFDYIEYEVVEQEGEDSSQYEENENDGDDDVPGDNDVVPEQLEGAPCFTRRLISLVEERLPLYAKKSAWYRNGKNYDKNLAWETVGASMKPPISGEQARKIFKSLREKFAKERNKEKKSQQGCSGQAFKPVEKSTWVFYEALTFLIPHIQPRKTATNYTSVKKPPQAAAGGTPVVDWAYSAKFSSSFGESSASCSSVAASSSRQAAETPFAIPNSPTSPSPSSASSISSAHMLTSTSGFSTPRRAAPEPDNFSKKKRKSDEMLWASLIESNQTMTKLAQKWTTESPPAQTPEKPALDPTLAAIDMALRHVPEEKKFPCMMKVLKVIQEEFCEQ